MSFLLKRLAICNIFHDGAGKSGGLIFGNVVRLEKVSAQVWFEKSAVRFQLRWCFHWCQFSKRQTLWNPELLLKNAFLPEVEAEEFIEGLQAVANSSTVPWRWVGPRTWDATRTCCHPSHRSSSPLEKTSLSVCVAAPNQGSPLPRFLITFSRLRGLAWRC